ncbi:Noc2p family protein [Necator americanus]|uniref:Noc2p family protein n=1 Tax=Necator americanus TaxID=51031 RepID=W2T227_NECAM|nr:Noc2p family protein [Necator americanus]ETN75037.1 Noc2p family protein [Necator americanus]
MPKLEGFYVSKESSSQIPKARKDSSGRLIFDGNMLNYLENALDPEDEKQRINVDDIRLAVEAFNACVARVGADIDAPKYIINEQAVFYATVRLCFEKLGDAFFTLITGKAKVKLEPGTSEEATQLKMRNVKKYQTPLKQYLGSVLTFANEVQTPDVIVSTLKAIRRMTDFYAHFKKMAKNLTKSCYLGFVSNSREVSSETWPILHFMHKTFAEVTVLHPNLAYPYAFVYIRQIAIHLRNAIISKKRKDMVRTVYNWQMMQCLYLWTRVISKAHAVHDCEAICDLTYPLVQLINGVLKLYHSLRYIPLRLHCISLLIQLQANCGIFVPSLTLAVELLDDVVLILAKKPKIVKNVKVVDMESSLKAAHLICSQPSFPDVIVPMTFRCIGGVKRRMLKLCSPSENQKYFIVYSNIRNFLRKIRSVEFARCFRALLEKLEEQGKFVADILLTKGFTIKDDIQVMSLQLALNNPDSPLRTYYRQWEKAWRMKQKMLLKVKAKPVHRSLSEKKENTKEAKQITKKKNEKKQKMEQDVKVEEKPKKKRRLSQPAAARADATIPDQLGDLENWSDSE